jgi:hypothetical protein
MPFPIVPAPITVIFFISGILTKIKGFIELKNRNNDF